MSAVITSKTTKNHDIECVLSASDSYIETLSIRTIDLQPGLLELAIRTQLLSAKNPAETRVTSRTCINLANLVGIRSAIDRYLENPEGSRYEPAPF